MTTESKFQLIKIVIAIFAIVLFCLIMNEVYMKLNEILYWIQICKVS